MKIFFPVLFLLLVYACESSSLIQMSEEEIDEYVGERRDTAVVYDVEESLMYSREDESYHVTAYSLEDTLVYYVTEEMSENHSETVNYFLKDQLPVYIESSRFDYLDTTTRITERRMYLNGEVITIAFERSAGYDEDMETKKFEERVIETEDYEIGRPQRAMAQAGEFAMQFNDFLIINPDAYMVLKNKESGYSVALYIQEGDMLLDEIYEHPEDYKGKVIQVRHEFKTMNGIERMIYRGGIVKEE
ncbi:MAG: hypothetical protein WDZ35_05010 [Crocinitomicaceae bacterium]